MPRMNEYVKGKSIRLSKNFVSTEFDCNGSGCCKSTPIADELITLLQYIRNTLGSPINLTCGYRCLKHNAAVSGASTTSKHILGQAADIQGRMSPVKIAYIAEQSGIVKGLGLYYYGDNSGWVHVDVANRMYRGVYTEDNRNCDYLTGRKKLFITLKEGSTGRMVKVLQLLLKDLNLYSGKIDKKFGPLMKEAVEAFQVRYALKKDGSFGPGCWKKMCMELL